jgi:hypothetical protein
MSVTTKRIDTDVPKNVRLYGTDTAGGVVPMLTDLSGQLSVEVSVSDTLVAKISGEILRTFYSGNVTTIVANVTLSSSSLSGATYTSAAADVRQAKGISMQFINSGSAVLVASVYTSPNNVVYDTLAITAVTLAATNVKTVVLSPGIGYVKVYAANSDSGSISLLTCNLLSIE